MNPMDFFDQNKEQAPHPAAPVSSSAPVPLQGEKLLPPLDETPEQIGFALSHRSSPLPPPDEFREYADMIPDGADRLMKMAERQQAQQHAVERRQEHRATLGVVCATTSVSGTLLLSGYGFYTGHAVEAAAVFGATITAIVTVFIRGTATRSDKDEDDK